MKLFKRGWPTRGSGLQRRPQCGRRLSPAQGSERGPGRTGAEGVGARLGRAGPGPEGVRLQGAGARRVRADARSGHARRRARRARRVRGGGVV